MAGRTSPLDRQRHVRPALGKRHGNEVELRLGRGSVTQAALAGQIGGDLVRLSVANGDVAGEVTDDERGHAGDDDALRLFALGRHLAA